MKINLDTQILSLEGLPFLKSKDPEVFHTVRSIAVQALMSPPTDPQEKLNGETSFERAKLAERIYNTEGPIELTVKEVSNIKDLAGKIFIPEVILSFYNALENPEFVEEK